MAERVSEAGEASPEVLYEVKDAVARLTINRPDKRNPLSPSVIGALLEGVARARADEAVRVVVVTGAGKVFSAGGDLSAMGKPGASGGQGIAGSLPDLFMAMARLGKPVVAMVNGHALAGGCGLVAACDMAIAADDATFGTPEINVGLWPMMIMAVIFRAVGRKKGLELCTTGERISAAEAERIGLINRVVPRDRLEAETEALCGKLAQKSPAVMALGLAGYHAIFDGRLEADLSELQARFLEVLGTEDAREGLMAFLEKRTPCGRAGSLALDRYETFVGWRYLFRRRRSQLVLRITVLLALASLGAWAAFRFGHFAPGSSVPAALAATSVLSLIGFACAFFLNFFSVFTTVSIAGVFLGVAALTVVLSVTSGFQQEFQSKVLALNAHAIVMKYGLDFGEYREVMKKVEKVPHVVAAAPFVFNEMMLSHDAQLSGVIVKGIVPGVSDRVLEVDAHLDGGVTSKVLAQPDGSGMPRILLGRELARKLKARVGDVVRVISPLGTLDPSLWTADEGTPKMREFRVAGLLYFGFDEYDRRLVVVALPEAQSFFQGGDVVTGVELRLDDIYRSREVVREIDNLLDGAPYRVIDWRELNHNLFTALALQKVALSILLTLIVLVAAFGIVATLTMLVIDKTREIAILKSLGMRAGGVARVFQTAGMTIGALGTSAGLVIGLTVCKFVERYGYHLDPRVYLIDKLPVDVHSSELLLTAVVTLVICFLATIYPSLRAASLRPVEGLRYE